MTQQAQAQQTVREEERVLPITYERALVMVPKLVREATGLEVEMLGDGYFVASGKTDRRKRDVTIRLGRQSADTRVSVRVETYADPAWVAMFIILAIFTAGLGILPLIPYLAKMQREQSRERDLLVHNTFRAIEDAVAEQGVAGNYRVGPGADAVQESSSSSTTKEDEAFAALEEAAAEEEAASAAKATRSSS